VRKGDYKPQILVLTSSRPDRPLTAAELRRIGGQRCNLQFLGFRDQVSSDDFPPGFFVDGVSFTTPGLVEQIIRFWSLEDEFRYDDEMRQESILLAEIDPGHWVQLSMLPENVRLAAPSLPPPPAGFEISI
jgi:hypothetical protein